MSKIQAELIKATGVKLGRGQERQEFIIALMKGVTELSDKAWEGLSQEAQDWFNDAADAKNAKKKVLPDFPDLEEETPAEEEAPKTARRGATKEEAKPELKKGIMVKITNKRGKDFTGTVVELDDDVVVLEHGDKSETEIDRSRIDFFEVLSGGGVTKAKDEPTDPMAVGATVTVTNKRGKVTTGKIVEIDDSVLVLDVDGEEVEFDQARVESIVPAGGKAKPAAKEDPEEEAPKTTRRGAAKEDAKPETADKPKRASNEGVSVGGRIRELMCADTEMTVEDVEKELKKDGLEFRETTLNMIYKDTANVFKLLKTNKKLK